MRLLVKHTEGPVKGEIVVPGSKYHAHRALILAALAPGVSRIDGLCDAGHVGHTIAALRALGTEITADGQGYLVRGGPFRPTRAEVGVGSSGTTLYFLTGLASLANTPVTITGQKYFRRRPITPLLAALEGLGVRLSSASGCPPIHVKPGRPAGGRVRIAGTLSQWISGLLLLAPFATGPTVIEVDGELNERRYVDLTIEMMAKFGLRVAADPAGRWYQVEPGQEPRPATVTLPPDIGAAAFGLAAAALHPADVLFRGLPAVPGAHTDHPEAELLDIVAGMGLPMVRDSRSGQVRVRHDGVRLAPVEADCRRVPDMLPMLAVLASAADGVSVLHNVAHVRLKESDRVSAMLQLNRMGGRVAAQGDRLVVHGVGALRGADLSSFNDHRVLMSLAVAGSHAAGETRLTYPNAYRISYPGFLEAMNTIGIEMSVVPAAGKRAPSPAARRGGVTPAWPAWVTIGDWVRRWAVERPGDPAVIQAGADGTGERVRSWADLDKEADQAAQLLLALGVAPGEVVACQLPNIAELTVLAVAITRIGALCCPIMPIFRQRETGFMLRRAKARVVVVPERFRGRDYPAEIAELKKEAATEAAPPLAVEHVIVVGGTGALAASPGMSWRRYADAIARYAPQRDSALLRARKPAPDALAQLLFTSGTSGEPKGVLHRMDALTRAAATAIHHLGLGERDRIFVPSPMAHQTGFLYGMWLGLLLGVPQILQPSWDGRAALALLRRHRATFTQAATPFLADIVAAAEEAGEQPEELRIFVATGTAVPHALAERATRTLNVAVCGAWGTTETCLGSLAWPGDDPARTWGADGRQLDGVRLRITDRRGATLGPGQEGNLEARTGSMFAGYLDRPDLTAEAMTPDGFFRTGDLAVLDADEYLRITGRVKDVINRGGEKIPVAEIEQLLHRHPRVREAAVVAMPDDRLGERACAFVVTEPGGGFDLDELRRFLDQAQVAKQYWPERVEAVDAMPRTASGKIQKFALRERIRIVVEREKRSGERV